MDEKQPNAIEKWRQHARQDIKSKASQLNHSKSHSNNKIKQVKGNIKEFSGQLASIHVQRKKILKEVIRILQEMPSDNPSSPKAQQWLLDYVNYTDSLKDLAKELAAQSETIVHTEPLIGKFPYLFKKLARVKNSLWYIDGEMSLYILVKSDF